MYSIIIGRFSLQLVIKKFVRNDMRYKSHFTRLFMPTDKTIITMSTHKNCDVRFFEVSNI